jgi:hypothetical protein
MYSFSGFCVPICHSKQSCGFIRNSPLVRRKVGVRSGDWSTAFLNGGARWIYGTQIILDSPAHSHWTRCSILICHPGILQLVQLVQTYQMDSVSLSPMMHTKTVPRPPIISNVGSKEMASNVGRKLRFPSFALEGMKTVPFSHFMPTKYRNLSLLSSN